MNAAGLESGNDGFVMGKTTPLLQDTTDVNAWAAWAVTYRDVVIVDAQGKKRDAYNLTTHDLSNSTNVAELKQRLLDAR